MVNRGDLIGCTLKFELESNGKVPVVFSLNGKQVTDEEVLIEYNKTTKQIYPFIGMGQHGIQVLAKVMKRLRKVNRNDHIRWKHLKVGLARIFGIRL